jgi:hypothetical protein
VFGQYVVNDNAFEQAGCTGHSYALCPYVLAACWVAIIALAVVALVRPRLGPVLARWLLLFFVAAAALMAEHLFYLWNLSDPSYAAPLEAMHGWVAISAIRTPACVAAALVYRSSLRERRNAPLVEPWLNPLPQDQDGRVSPRSSSLHAETMAGALRHS